MSETLSSSDARPGKLLDAALQAPGLADADIDEVRGLIGVWLRRDVHTPAIYEPVSLHDIRRWAQYSVGDDNPLFGGRLREAHALDGTIAPPTFLYTIEQGIVAPGLPGIQWIFAGAASRISSRVRRRHDHGARAADRRAGQGRRTAPGTSSRSAKCCITTRTA